MIQVTSSHNQMLFFCQINLELKLCFTTLQDFSKGFVLTIVDRRVAVTCILLKRSSIYRDCLCNHAFLSTFRMKTVPKVMEIRKILLLQLICKLI